MNPCPQIIHPWWQWHLNVGVAIGLLAALGVLVPWFRGNARRHEKALWTMIMFLLVGTELWSIHWSETWRNDEEINTRCIQRQEFETVASEAQKATQSAKQGVSKMNSLIASASEIATTVRGELSQVTGNGEFCFLSAALPLRDNNGNALWGLQVAARGDLPLEVCHVRVTSSGPIVSAEDAERRMRQPIASEDLGPLAPGKTKGLKGLEGTITNIAVPAGPYYVQITTRNNRFYEFLMIHPDMKGHGLQSIAIFDSRQREVYGEDLAGFPPHTLPTTFNAKRKGKRH